ncbi:macro domain-containing protein, partial [Patescibacteria group bacterium]|nr:macro domain-containing protein [Patescibacteria group bacterium]
ARYVIHAVGPVYRYGSSEVADLLASAYRNSLVLASKHRIKSIAFPSISTGIYGYPIEEAAPIAIEAVDDYLDLHDDIELVRFVLFNDRDYTVYSELLRS